MSATVKRKRRAPAKDGGDGGPRLDHLANPTLLVLVITQLDDAQELFRAAVEVLLVTRLRQREAFPQLAVDLRAEEQGAALIEFHDAFVRGQGFEP